MKTADEYEKEVFEYLVDSGKTIDDNTERFIANNRGIISGRIEEYASQFRDKKLIEKQDLLNNDDIIVVTAILHQIGRTEMAMDLQRRYNNLIRYFESEISALQEIKEPIKEEIQGFCDSCGSRMKSPEIVHYICMNPKCDKYLKTH